MRKISIDEIPVWDGNSFKYKYAGKPKELLKEIRKDFQILGHKITKEAETMSPEVQDQTYAHVLRLNAFLNLIESTLNRKIVKKSFNLKKRRNYLAYFSRKAKFNPQFIYEAYLLLGAIDKMWGEIVSHRKEMAKIYPDLKKQYDMLRKELVALINFLKKST